MRGTSLRETDLTSGSLRKRSRRKRTWHPTSRTESHSRAHARRGRELFHRQRKIGDKNFVNPNRTQNFDGNPPTVPPLILHLPHFDDCRAARTSPGSSKPGSPDCENGKLVAIVAEFCSPQLTNLPQFQWA
ncbi:hypothetical protein THTE_4202 [Thermogutta terrifontis]|uniref:Uncharacterized protein n=1 Tax=Thermogutta terrifontis TaxID=1331910 RepID=A0A286RLG0_9BACT|nr:hypothetical protein THTE_4202 [Thermogutta terrifontis]